MDRHLLRNSPEQRSAVEPPLSVHVFVRLDDVKMVCRLTIAQARSGHGADMADAVSTTSTESGEKQHRSIVEARQRVAGTSMFARLARSRARASHLMMFDASKAPEGAWLSSGCHSHPAPSSWAGPAG